jgi:hypothetical protein
MIQKCVASVLLGLKEQGVGSSGSKGEEEKGALAGRPDWAR